MGKALECLCGFATAPGTTPTNLTMAIGNSLTIRNAPLTSLPLLLAVWTNQFGAGVLRIKSPRLHDNVQGVRLNTLALNPNALWPLGITQKLVPQDTLTEDLTGSATAGKIESAFNLIYYPDCPGIAARLASPADVLSRMANIVGVEIDCNPGAGGGWTGARALNYSYDLLKANTDYALLGYIPSVNCGAVRFTGVDTGNVGVAGPGNITLPGLTSRWFLELSEKLGLPLVPILNSANRAGISVDVSQDQAATAVNVTAILAEIGSSPSATQLGT
ncbi:MAG: hypothetical protein ABSH05_23185 [Bryobacteraceae bacterium]|jgi:hypothetical protein